MNNTPLTAKLVASILDQTGEVGLCYEDNVRAYRWHLFEKKHPTLARLVIPLVTFIRRRPK